MKQLGKFSPSMHVLLVFTGLPLAACGDDVAIEEEPLLQNDLTGQITFMGLSGDRNGMNGTWIGCLADGSDSTGFKFEFDGSITTTTLSGFTGVTDCSIAPGSSDSMVTDGASYGTKTATWTTSPPSGLPSTVTASYGIGTDINNSADFIQLVGIVDDAVSPRVAYGGFDTPLDADGYPEQRYEGVGFVEQ